MVDLSSIPTHQPASVADLGDLVRRAAADGQAIYPAGGRTMLDFGLPPTKPGIVIDTRRLDQVIDYPARDMTITVQAGITVAKLQALLRRENQRLPIDVPLPDTATLGGAVACNVSGPRRYGYGTLRDYVIGISVVNDRGEETKAGGRVVKNVAGYDLCKLHIGALGTLGVITQLTLKVRPLPEQTRLLAFTCPVEEVGPLLDRLHESKTQLACIDLLSPSMSAALAPEVVLAAERWLVVIGFENNRDAVAWQLAQLRREVGQTAVAEWSDGAAEAMMLALSNCRVTLPASVAFQANLLPSRCADFCRFAQPLVGRLQAHAGNGIVLGFWPADASLDQVARALPGLREQARNDGGSVRLVHCRRDLCATLDTWGPAAGDWELMRAVKKQLDPKELFNPGRFVGGI